MKYITRTIWILSWVSLFTDTASEMLYPVMPLYLKSIGFSILWIGILEGIAEATAGLSKSYFGKRSDLSGKRVPFVQLGYGLSALSKPMMAFFIAPLWIFFARTLDRLGKGIRTAARDAILSTEAGPLNKGKVFGFHRSMDTLGAVLGPSMALLYLYFYPTDYKTLFLIAFLPGVMALLLTLTLKEKPTSSVPSMAKASLFSFVGYWKKSPATYRKLVIGLLVFTLFNSSDVFLLLKARQSGLSDTATIGVYIFYNLVYALLSFPMGHLADMIGFKKTMLFGLLLFSLVYLGMIFFSHLYLIALLFFLYGTYAAATEGISKAWICTLIEPQDTATAMGTYTGFQSICTMLASTLTGILWYQYGASVAFAIPGIITLLVILYLGIVVRNQPQ